MKKLYIGCPLTKVPRTHRKKFFAAVAGIKTELREYFDVLEFLGPTKGTCTDVYVHDIKKGVKKAHCLLAIYAYSAEGLVYEIATAVEACRMPVVLMLPQHLNISRLIVGVDSPNFHIVRYDSIEEIPNKFLAIALSIGLLE